MQLTIPNLIIPAFELILLGLCIGLFLAYRINRRPELDNPFTGLMREFMKSRKRWKKQLEKYGVIFRNNPITAPFSTINPEIYPLDIKKISESFPDMSNFYHEDSGIFEVQTFLKLLINSSIQSERFSADSKEVKELLKLINQKEI